MNPITLPGGWIYVLFSSSDYTRCKIGMTNGSPYTRFRNLRTGDPYLALHVAYFIPGRFGPASKIESRIHWAFSECRISNHEDSNSEWFGVAMSYAESEIDSLLEEWLGERVSGAHKIHLDVLTKMYESEVLDLFEPDPHEREFAAWIEAGNYE